MAAGVPFGKTHAMDVLADLASAAFPESRRLFDDTRRLTVWGVAYRYPSLEDEAEPLPEKRELQSTLDGILDLGDRLRSLRR